MSSAAKQADTIGASVLFVAWFVVALVIAAVGYDLLAGGRIVSRAQAPWAERGRP